MKNKIIIIATIVAIIIIGFYLFNQPTKNQQEVSSSGLIPARSISHGHGLAVDVADPNKVYIATHYGLLVLIDDKDLFRVGKSKDDYMGFSVHPTDPKVLLSSGHPSSGGNIGFQKSEDGGFTWKKVSNGQNGPVDFHAMTVSQITPNLIYGWYRGELQRSTDGGNSWEIAGSTNFPIVGLAADPKDENIVYAASSQGLMISKDKGKEWNQLLDGFVSTIAINPQDSQKLISYSEKQQLAKSSDGGQTWEKINADFSGETPLFISFSRQTPEIIYILTEKNSLYKSLDNGTNWNKIL